MKYIFLAFIFLFIAFEASAQKEEKVRYLLTDSEHTDFAYLNTIIQRIYWAADKGKIKAYYDPNLQNLIDSSDFKKVGSYCEKVLIQKDESCWSIVDSLVCGNGYPSMIETFSFKYQSNLVFPKSMAVELVRYKIKEIADPDFWVDFNELHKILTQKQITALLESTKYLPLIEDY